MTLIEKMKAALKRSGLTKAELARRMETSPQAVGAWFKTGHISKPMLAKFAKVTGADVSWLMSDDVEEPRATYTAGGLRDVPVIGFAIANPIEDGYFDDMGFPPGAGEGYIPWRTTDPNAYALRVRGDSMQPRIRPGELVVVEPSKAVMPGNDVVVRTRDGRKMVKQLLYQRGGAVTLGSINQSHKQLTISVEEIESMHFIAATLPPSISMKED
jgi:phage repressor protein C with HTH and peptisase S24 domain